MNLYCISVPCLRFFDDHQWSRESADVFLVRVSGLALLALLVCLRRCASRSVVLTGVLAIVGLLLWPLGWDDLRWDDAIRVRNGNLLSMRTASAARTVAALAPDISGARACARSSAMLCRFRNVCVSNRDGILVPDLPLALARQRELFGSDGWYRWGSAVPVALRLMRPAALLNKTRFYWAQGTVLVACCWRQGALSSSSPSHTLYGLGTVFEAALGRPRLVGSVDTLLLHQCTDTPLRSRHGVAAWMHGPGWSWGSTLWQHVHGAMQTRWPEAASNLVTLGRRNPTSSLPSADDVVVCGDEVWVPRMTATYLGTNSPATVAAWRSHIAPWLNRSGAAEEAQSIPFSTPPPGSAHRRMVACTRGCSSGLRVAIFQRVDGKWGRRFILNVERAVAVAQAYVSFPVRVITVTSQTPVLEQARLFQTFDVLISAHGSHLANMIYANEHAVIIELQAVPGAADTSFRSNALRVVGGHLMSYGHTPAGDAQRVGRANAASGASLDCVLARRMRPCWWGPRKGTGCKGGSSQFKNVDLLVDVGRLRAAVERAIVTFCARKPRHLQAYERVNVSGCENASATAYEYFNTHPPRLSEQCDES